jgi:integrase
MLSGILSHKFGHMQPDDLTTTDVAQFLEERRRQGAAVAGNRERAVLSAVFEFCLRHGYARANPCRGIARNTETPRRRYVTTEELQAAVNRAPKHTGLLLAFAYGTAMRMTDVIALKRADVREDGIYWTESKTGKPNHLPWSPWLRGIVAELRGHADEWAARRKRLPAAELMTNRYGRPWTPSGIEAAMKCLDVDWTFRDLRSKAETDRPGATGHQGQMQDRYIKVRRLRPVGQ